MDGRDRVTGGFLSLVWALRFLNILFGVAFAGLLVASFPGVELLAGRLAAKYGAGLDLGAGVAVFRVNLAIGVAAAVVVHLILAALSAILRSVRDGDPFAADTPARIRRVGWALLALQMLDLGEGGVVWWLSRLRMDAITWTPSVTGWLCVLVAFVLAQVFAHGGRMRDELATVV